jgi:hypothetical protein
MSEAKILVQKQVKGSILEYARARKKGAHLNWAVGIISAAINRKYVTKNEVSEMIHAIEENPIYLPSLSRNEKMKRLQPLRRILASIP